MASNGNHNDNDTNGEAMKEENRQEFKFQTEIGFVWTFHNCLLHSTSASSSGTITEAYNDGDNSDQRPR